MLSLFPPLIAIICAWYTREVLSSLFIAILAGGIISGKYNIVKEFIIPSVATENFAVILIVYLWALGGLIGVWTKTGGSETFARWAGKKMVRGPRSAKFFCWLMGMIFHQGGSISTVLTGTTVRPVADSNNVSHEELAYVVDSTSSPAATIIPFNVWPFYVSGLILGTIPLFQTKMEGVHFFFSGIYLNFYALFAILLTLLFSVELLPWYPGRKMKAAVQRARDGKGLNSKDARPMLAEELTKKNIPKGYSSGLADFFLPIGGLIGIIVLPFMVSYFILGQKEEPTLLITEAFLSAVLIAMLLALIKGMSLQDVISGFIDGL
jgi:Na+/H+ antiporter NhaC